MGSSGSDQTKNLWILFSPIFLSWKTKRNLIGPKRPFFSVEKIKTNITYIILLAKKIGEKNIRRFVVWSDELVRRMFDQKLFKPIFGWTNSIDHFGMDQVTKNACKINGKYNGHFEIFPTAV